MSGDVTVRGRLCLNGIVIRIAGYSYGLNDFMKYFNLQRMIITVIVNDSK